ncbi:MAG: NAD(+) synthase [Lachnospiraceae bacterium]|nr:NAD(+) synthase [Lachnospiraceae bacterium]
MENALNLFRVAVVTPRVHIGNVSKNCEEILNAYDGLADKTDLVVTPELSLTGYTCADLFNNRSLLNMALKGLGKMVSHTKKYGEGGAALVVGLPFEKAGELFNCAALIQNGQLVAIVPKTYLPNYGEFYEKRWFSAREYDAEELEINCGSEKLRTLFGNNIVINVGTDNAVCIGLEVCEDVWATVSPGRIMALNGAEIIVNISASNEVIGKAQYRRNLIGAASASCISGYVYVSAGRYESTSDLVFSGHNLMYENGKLIGECKPFEETVLVKDFNLTKIRHDRVANKTFSQCKNNYSDRKYRLVDCRKPLIKKEDILARVSITPFVPSKNRRERSLEIFNMQVAGLQRRIETTKSSCVVVGVSGGLDSTLALLVAAKAVKNIGLPSTTVTGITMPGFGTTKRTKNNSLELMKYLGCDIREISIVDSVRQHFKDIGQDENVHDITYENCQARERTQILMDVANKDGGFVIGTGDLSELALGWCTYNGDHMSMYAVNASIPKTLVRTLVDEIGHNMAENGFEGMDKVIEDIIDTPVSPELLPPNEDGTIAQKTEDTVGSYILHDFFLYYTLRYGMTPAEILELCKEAVRQSSDYKFSDDEIRKWQKVFYTRFFRQQFKRNCMPDGVKVGSVSVSPRGDLRLPAEIESEEFVNFEEYDEA